MRPHSCTAGSQRTFVRTGDCNETEMYVCVSWIISINGWHSSSARRGKSWRHSQLRYNLRPYFLWGQGVSSWPIVFFYSSFMNILNVNRPFTAQWHHVKFMFSCYIMISIPTTSPVKHLQQHPSVVFNLCLICLCFEWVWDPGELKWLHCSTGPSVQLDSGSRAGVVALRNGCLMRQGCQFN